jgi:1-acyl-sn-glycerol-3-phosphate acyltransferase
MSFFCDITPRNEPTLHSQDKPTHISDAQFKAAYTPKPISFVQRILQVIVFLVFGWVRLVLLLIFNFIFLILYQPLIPLCDRSRFAQQCALHLGTVYVRFMLFFLGLFWIRVKGSPAPDARQLCYNHTSPFDGALLFVKKIFTMVVAAGIKSVPVYGRLMTAGGALYIDRSHQSGNSRAITAVIEDQTRPPIALAPEAKLSNGDVVYKFRTGGFLTTDTFQPVTIRYYRLLPWVGCTPGWLCPGIAEFFWNLFAAPGFIADLTFLDPVRADVLSDKTPEQRAEIAQLAIANSLGTLAIDKSTKDFFQHTKNE